MGKRENPFKGISLYRETESELFRGRNEIKNGIVNKIVDADSLFTIMFGQSGIGKSSLINAGLFPELRKQACYPLKIAIPKRPESPLNYKIIVNKDIIEGIFNKIFQYIITNSEHVTELEKIKEEVIRKMDYFRDLIDLLHDFFVFIDKKQNNESHPNSEDTKSEFHNKKIWIITELKNSIKLLETNEAKAFFPNRIDDFPSIEIVSEVKKIKNIKLEINSNDIEIIKKEIYSKIDSYYKSINDIVAKFIVEEFSDNYNYQYSIKPVLEALIEQEKIDYSWKSLIICKIKAEVAIHHNKYIDTENESLFSILEYFNNQNDIYTELVLFFDQFEELFQNSVSSKEVYDVFRDELKDLCNKANFSRNMVHIVFSFREDYLADFESFSSEINLKSHNRFRISGFKYNSACDIITENEPEFNCIKDKIIEALYKYQYKYLEYKPKQKEDAEYNSILLSVYCHSLWNKVFNDNIDKSKVVNIEQLEGLIYNEIFLQPLSDLSVVQKLVLIPKLMSSPGIRIKVPLQELEKSLVFYSAKQREDLKKGRRTGMPYYLVELIRKKLLVESSGNFIELIHDNLANHPKVIKKYKSYHDEWILRQKVDIDLYAETAGEITEHYVSGEITKHGDISSNTLINYNIVVLSDDIDQIKTKNFLINVFKNSGIEINSKSQNKIYILSNLELEKTEDRDDYKVEKKKLSELEILDIIIYLPVRNKYTNGEILAKKQFKDEMHRRKKLFIEFSDYFKQSGEGEKYNNYLLDKDLLDKKGFVNEILTFYSGEETWNKKERENENKNQAKEIREGDESKKIDNILTKTYQDTVKMPIKDPYNTVKIINENKAWDEKLLKDFEKYLEGIKYPLMKLADDYDESKNDKELKELIDKLYEIDEFNPDFKFFVDSKKVDGIEKYLEDLTKLSGSANQKIDDFYKQYFIFKKLTHYLKAKENIEELLNRYAPKYPILNDNLYILQNYANILLTQDEIESALKINTFLIHQFEKLKYDKMDLIYYYREIAGCYVALEKFDQAKILYESTQKKISESDHTHGYIYGDLASLYYRKGKPEEAIEQCKLSIKSLKINFDDSHIFFWYEKQRMINCLRDIYLFHPESKKEKEILSEYFKEEKIENTNYESLLKLYKCSIEEFTNTFPEHHVYVWLELYNLLEFYILFQLNKRHEINIKEEVNIFDGLIKKYEHGLSPSEYLATASLLALWYHFREEGCKESEENIKSAIEKYKAYSNDDNIQLRSYSKVYFYLAKYHLKKHLEKEKEEIRSEWVDYYETLCNSNESNEEKYGWVNDLFKNPNT